MLGLRKRSIASPLHAWQMLAHDCFTSFETSRNYLNLKTGEPSGNSRGGIVTKGSPKNSYLIPDTDRNGRIRLILSSLGLRRGGGVAHGLVSVPATGGDVHDPESWQFRLVQRDQRCLTSNFRHHRGIYERYKSFSHVVGKDCDRGQSRATLAQVPLAETMEATEGHLVSHSPTPPKNNVEHRKQRAYLQLGFFYPDKIGQAI